MALSELQLEHQYRPSTSNLVDDFYIPCLTNSIRYDRAVGYFTSGSLFLAARGLSCFIQNGGKMRLIASPYLEDQDLAAIQLGYEARTDVIERALLRQIPDTLDPIVNQRLGFLAWMISQGKLDVKIACLQGVGNGLYHEKIGSFYDDSGNIVAFSGSSNETIGGLHTNFELIEAFCSWRDGDYIRVQNKITDFEGLWNNDTENLTVLDFPEAVKIKLLTKIEHFIPGQSDLESVAGTTTIPNSLYSEPSIPEGLEIRDYQKEAVSNWFASKGKGILQMATGTGKTITALIAATKVYEKTKSLGLVIMCPYIELVDQWANEAKRFGMTPILAYESQKIWAESLNNAITSYNMGTRDHFLLITTNATFLTEAMQETLKKIRRRVMIIADEAHHLGAENISKKLPANFDLRLGLSATPLRWFDENGTETLFRYFEPGIIFEFGLKRAIQEGHLTKYNYFPHIVYLNEEESTQYHEITRKISKILLAKSDFDLDDPGLQGLLIKRARILSGAQQKIELLKELVEPDKNSNYNIFYCGDAKVGDIRQIENVIKVLGNEIGMKVHPFTSNEDKETRQKLLARFKEGQLQGLVAIRCLDEGVDVPATRTAYILASSTNPREFIQRRGRVLRKYPGKKFSTIHDFIVLPRRLQEVYLVEDSIFNVERKLFKRELLRVIEFADLAENGPQAIHSLQKYKEAYNLLDL